MKTTMKVLATAAFMVASFASLKAQDTIKATADLVTSYVWRGVYSSYSPNFQPTLAYDHGNLEIGVWGSTDFLGALSPSYKEADLYVSYAIGAFKMTLTDYNWNFKTSYFKYTDSITDHIFELGLAYTLSGSFPLSISANTMLYGADKKWDSNMGMQDPKKQAYSTYIELDYPIKNANIFVGMTPMDGYYGDGYGGHGGFSVCNIGVTATRNLKITSDYSFPLRATFGLNPQKEDAYFVFGFTF